MLIVNFNRLLQNVQSFFVREHMLQSDCLAVQGFQRGLVNRHGLIETGNCIFI